MRKALIIAAIVLCFGAVYEYKHSQAIVIPSVDKRAITFPVDREFQFVESHPLAKPMTSVADLMRAVANDPALAAFYRSWGFDVTCAMMETLQHDTWGKTSWRRGNTFGFGTESVLLLAGEVIFRSCGAAGVVVRAKCGNLTLLADGGMIQESLAEEGPLVVPMDVFPTTAYLPADFDVPSFGTPIPTITGGPQPPPPGNWWGVPCCGGGGGGNPPIETPEPGTLVLSGIGLLMIFALVTLKGAGDAW